MADEMNAKSPFVVLSGGGTAGELSKWEYTALGVATVGGGVLGYRLGYKDEPDTSNEQFVRHLQDAGIWKAVNEDFRRLYSSSLRTAISGTMDQKDLNVDAQLVKGLRKMHPEIFAIAKAETQSWANDSQPPLEIHSSKAHR
jgi:hypothetical protein